MKPQLTIRAAHVADATCVAKLIQSVAYYFLSDPSGADAERFISSISEAAIADYIKSPELNYIVGEFGYQLAGAAAIKILCMSTTCSFYRHFIGKVSPRVSGFA